MISASDMSNILNASSAIIAPYSAAKLKITVSCVAIDGNSKATVKWSVTRNDTARSGVIAIPRRWPSPIRN